MLRIVGGVAGGRRLVAPDKGTRPTSERAREAMFNTLAASMRLDGARVLDLFAGSGAVGLEALSRGAAEVVLVESRRAAVDVIRRNVEAVGLPGVRVVQARAEKFLEGAAGEAFDLVFADPPYEMADEEVARLLAPLKECIGPDSVVVIERSSRSAGPQWSALGYNAGRERRYGDAVLWYGRPR